MVGQLYPRHCDIQEADRLLVILSDIEMGAGGERDDFPQSDFLGELILSYNQPPLDRIPVEFIFNGDTFDLLKTSYMGDYPRQITVDVALGKMARVAAAHPKFFEALRHVLHAHHRDPDLPPRRVAFVTGNHDYDLAFPEVQRFITSLTGGEERVEFPGFQTTRGRVWIEHGSQHDPLFHIDAEAPLVDYNGRRILNISWATVALLEVGMPLMEHLYFHDRLNPKSEVLDLVPQVRDVVYSAFWRYWTRDYWRSWFAGNDPMKKISWGMLKELARRLTTKDVDVSASRYFDRQLRDNPDYDLFVFGHEHAPGMWSYANRRVLRTGCFRNEYVVLKGGERLRPLPKTFAEVFLRGDEVFHAELVDVMGPKAEDLDGAPLFDAVEKIRHLLPSAEEATAREAAERASREEEADESEQVSP